MEESGSARGRGRLLVCFDFEGAHGMPHEVPYDLNKATGLILERLAQYHAKAIFFVVGRIVEEHPDIVQAIADGGHEIGLHGYEHDNLSYYDDEKLALFGKNLARVGSLVEDMTGARPRGFRAPYLLWPHFFRSDVYALLKAQGYQWVSNLWVHYPVQLFRPGGRLSAALSWEGSGGMPRMMHNRLMRVPLNGGMLAKGNFGGSTAGRLRWLLGAHSPFIREGLTEVPVYSPLDCDLLGLPKPDCDTSPDALAYTRAVLQAAAVTKGDLSMITFHDWIVAGGNRLSLLEDALAAARDGGMNISTIAENPDWLPLPG